MFDGGYLKLSRREEKKTTSRKKKKVEGIRPDSRASLANPGVVLPTNVPADFTPSVFAPSRSSVQECTKGRRGPSDLVAK
ncbi:hypothetical protein K0M31_003917 [Melipona bicolor]|uniref:Uncharacterized protein n=1 Tax=Melipona bicolor TaxID=60889 RepID=A0AA40FY90_9HYME|nr:hypothetical protein K0M31_003917 [Melipona bicolor]